ncbi:MAG: methyltransferase [Chloroflexi bacterium]|nr:MAG: methyltransferase [Chloroflexota bacterium]
MTSRERVQLALSHQVPDRIPLDLGACAVTGMPSSTCDRLRQALALDPPGTPVKVIEPYQMLGEITPDLLARLGADVVPLFSTRTMFGFRNEGWKPWTLFDGTPVLVPAGMNTDPEPQGDILVYPEGDRTAPPAGRMPHGGYYFDSITYQPPVDEASLTVEDNLEEFGPVSDAELEYFRGEAERLYTATDRAILGDFGGTSFGDISLVPGPALKNPQGIRDVEEWYVSTVKRRRHVYRIFERQCEIGIANLERIYQAVGERISVVFVSGTDFGTQAAPFLSPKSYRELYQPFHCRVNDWVHEHTGWKTFLHTCGSVMPLIEQFIDAGFDILNPVQWSAANMDRAELKERFGDRVTFWGGGVNSQRTLPFGTPGEVRAEVRESIRLLGAGGGYVFNTIHNVQPGVPVENLLAMYEAVNEQA